jgi:hypothetical protein
MSELKLNIKLFGMYFQITKENKFIILRNEEGQWRNILN